MIPGWTELLLAFVVGMGPLKATFFYMEKTADYDRKTRDKVAIYAVLTAVGSAIGLLLLGAGLQSLLHFSIGALNLGGGLILLLFCLRVVLETSDGDEHEHKDDPVELAVSPIGLPLILNPVGIVALVTFSAEASTAADYGRILAVVLIIGLLDVVALFLAGRLGTFIPHAVINLIERVFSILVTALAVQIMVIGLKQLGIL
jgi:small neutral amino acid transporter SnatA (MarC family)